LYEKILRTSYWTIFGDRFYLVGGGDHDHPRRERSFVTEGIPMKSVRSLLNFCLALSFALIQLGCDRTTQQYPSNTQQKTIEIPESVTLSIESLIDRVVATDKEEIEEAHKKGNSKAVGMADGKWWMENGRLAQLMYLRGASDIAIALGDINAVTSQEVDAQRQKRNLDYQFGSSSLTAPEEAESKLSGRIEAVTRGHTFGDLAEAVTKFYRDKPLLKDKPVLWVLAVPLYKEHEDAKPQDKKSTYYDSVEADMIKKQSVNQ
jgi:hypothetical protein